MTTKPLAMHQLLSLTTGYMLSPDFGDVHEAAEHVAGHPIWTHEFVEVSLWHRLRDAVFAEHPDLREAEAFVPLPKTASKDACRAHADAYVARMVATLGAERSMPEGAWRRGESPIASARRIAGPDKPILAVGAPELAAELERGRPS